MNQQLTLYKLKDRDGQTCEVCGKSYYKETSIHDVLNGVLHCSKCNHEVKKYKEVWTDD